MRRWAAGAAAVLLLAGCGHADGGITDYGPATSTAPVVTTPATPEPVGTAVTADTATVRVPRLYRGRHGGLAGGVELDRAVDMLAAQGLAAGVPRVGADSEQRPVVERSAPRPGAPAPAGSTVSLAATGGWLGSPGCPTVVPALPDLVGRTLDVAAAHVVRWTATLPAATLHGGPLLGAFRVTAQRQSPEPGGCGIVTFDVAAVSPAPPPADPLLAAFAVATRLEWDAWPRYAGTRDCAIQGGGPWPGSVHDARCTTRVARRADGSARIELVQTSAARPSDTYAWRFAVDARGSVRALGGSGTWAPQLER